MSDQEDIIVTEMERMELPGSDGSIMLNRDGGMDVDLDGGAFDTPERTPQDPAAEEHDANLAEFMAEGDLDELGQRLIDLVNDDKETRVEWENQVAEGLRIMGLTRDQRESDNTSTYTEAVWPMLAEASVQFGARAMRELFPSEGPVKGKIVGPVTEETEAQRDRIVDHMNYQVAHDLEGEWYTSKDKLLFWMPITGSVFTDSFFDDVDGVTTSETIKPQDLIVPFDAESLQQSPRVTRSKPYTRTEVRRMQLRGEWLDIDLAEPAEDDEENPLDRAIEEVDGREDAGAVADDDKDDLFTIYEIMVDEDLAGFEHIGDGGEETGLPLPYKVVVERDSGQVLCIKRNWREGDERFRKVCTIKHYYMWPGPGFYGIGFLHILGRLSDASTDALRLLLIAGAFASQQGGFMGKLAAGGAKQGKYHLTPGDYNQLDVPSEDLDKILYTPPFKGPDMALHAVLGTMDEVGRRFASTTDVLQGDAGASGPVGTMVALIEQGMTVHSAIHLRLHRALGQELELRAEINGQHLTEYPFDPADGQPRNILRADYDGRVDVVPVSDPNIYSQTQRIAIAQGLKQLAAESPDLYNRYEVERRMLEALKVPEIDEVLINPFERQRTDAVTEGAMMIAQRPVWTFPDQDHEAHLAAHMALFQSPQMQDPNTQQLVGPLLMAHIAEHQAYLYRNQIMAASGIELPPMDLGVPPGEEATPDLPPEIEAQISAAGAEASAAMMQQAPALQPPQDPAQAAAEAAAAEEQVKAEAEQAKWQADEERKQASWEAEETRKEQSWQNEQRRKDAETVEKANRDAQLEAEKSAGRQRETDDRMAGEAMDRLTERLTGASGATEGGRANGS